MAEEKEQSQKTQKTNQENAQSVKSEPALREERILEFWKENKIFEKSLEKSKGKKEFVFYEGPPTANGKPGIHHLLARAFKDVIPRYKTMRGYHVRRKGGWDTHGLPVELQVEKKLGLNSKKAIEEYGIAKFNQECKESVWEYTDLWKKFTERIGYWVDQENPYVTYHNSYIESVWNIIKKVDEQGLLYKDYKVVPWCPRCGTALSSHELAQGYETVKDLSVYVKFKVKKGQKIGDSLVDDDTYILAWTTTPWTLPGNVALAVGEEVEYVKVREQKHEASISNQKGIYETNASDYIYIAKNILEKYEKINLKSYQIPNTSILLHDEGYGVVKGKDLAGLEYEPLYPFLKDTISENEKSKLEKAYKVYTADFVTTEDGTGVVHTAVMYGQDDFALGTEIGLPKHHLVGLDGKFLKGTGIFEGRFVRDEEVAVDVIKDLAHRNLLFHKEKYEHSYPHCWRCHTALIYYARDSWYIRMSDPKIKEKLISENENINWEPSHLREGRFGEWLREIKDWAISRERYWGTPLPVWTCDKCAKKEVIGSLEELKKKTKKSGNRYFVMRHGESESNLKKIIIDCKVESEDHLSNLGKEQVKISAKELKDKNIDIIISSDFIRTKETSEIVKKELNLKNDIILDQRLREWDVGVFNGKTWEEYVSVASSKYYYTFLPEGGESWKQIRNRMMKLIFDLNQKYKDKNILLISHGAPIRVFLAGLNGESNKEVERVISDKNRLLVKNAEVFKFDFVPLPHNEDYELDLHRPYIDETELECDCGGKLTRSKEVMDVWLDSGTMPFSQDHYPFENKEWVEGAGYPADYISEAIDQTRGWFYTLHAVGVLLGRGKAFKNVICLGHLLDANGKKMSKSLGNVVDPWEMIEKYGVDTIRLWMYSVNQPGESKNFDEKTVLLLHRQVFGLLYNILSFYELYRDRDLEKDVKPNSKNILDKWILARLDELIEYTTLNLENYKLLEPVRAIRDFIDDLSTWYLRRSRENIKEGDKDTKQTLYFVLKNLAKILAPFAPESAEDIWLKLKNDTDAESVHLVEWPSIHKSIFNIFGKNKNNSLIEDMKKTREIVTQGLDGRQKSGIKVRQPLSFLKIKESSLGEEYLELIKDELNVKEIGTDSKIEGDVWLDTNITPLLKEEGDYRELLRAIQDTRKKLELTPSDIVSIHIQTDEKGVSLIKRFETDLLKTAGAREVLLEKTSEENNDFEKIKIDGLEFRIRIGK